MKDRVPRYPGRVKMTPVAGQANTYDMVRADEPTQVGTPLNKKLLDFAVAANGVTRGTGTAYILDADGFTLTDGAKVNFKLHVDSGATPTININGTGAKSLMQSKVKPMKAGIPAGTWLTAVYHASFGFFVLQGSSISKGTFGNETGQVSEYELAMAQFYNHFTRRF